MDKEIVLPMVRCCLLFSLRKHHKLNRNRKIGDLSNKSFLIFSHGVGGLDLEIGVG